MGGTRNRLHSVYTGLATRPRLDVDDVVADIATGTLVPLDAPDDEDEEE